MEKGEEDCFNNKIIQLSMFQNQLNDQLTRAFNHDFNLLEISESHCKTLLISKSRQLHAKLNNDFTRKKLKRRNIYEKDNELLHMEKKSFEKTLNNIYMINKDIILETAFLSDYNIENQKNNYLLYNDIAKQAHFYTIFSNYLKKYYLFDESLNTLFKCKDIIGINDLSISADIACQIGKIYLLINKFSNAENFYKEALSLHTKKNGERSLETVPSLNELALLFCKTGRIKQSLKTLQVAQKIHIFNSNFNLLYTETLFLMGNLYYEKRKYSHAIISFQKAYISKINIIGEENFESICCLDKIALCYLKLNKKNKAIDIIRKAMNNRFNDKYGMSKTLLIQAHYYLNIKKFENAKKSFQDSLNLRLEIFGENHLKTSKVLYHIGLYCHLSLCDYEKSSQALRKALNIRKSVYRKNHKKIADCYFAFGKLYQDQKNAEIAYKYYKKAIKIKNKLGIEYHPQDADCYYELGNISFSQKQYVQAFENSEKSLKIRLASHGEIQKETSDCYYLLGRICFEIKDYEKGIIYFEKALNIFKSIKVKDYIPKTHTYLGCIYSFMNRYNEAVIYHSYALKDSIKLYGERHIDVVTAYYNLALNNNKLSINYSQNELMLKKALCILEDLKDQGTFEKERIFEELGSLYEIIGNYKESFYFYNKAQEIYYNNRCMEDFKNIQDKINILDIRIGYFINTNDSI